MYKLSCKLGNIYDTNTGTKHESNEFLRTNFSESLYSEKCEQATDVRRFTCLN